MTNIVPIAVAHHGATEDQWYQLSAIMDHGADLLPVVSNPKATLSANSTIRSLGKVPSIYNGQREVVGLANWTTKIATPADIERWSRNRDYGICIQCRDVRAFDGDIEDPVKAARIVAAVERVLGFRLPMRTRPNSGKFLLAFRLPGDYPKRTMKVDGGMNEFLANGNQFVALGRHTSGVHYEWRDGFPPVFPILTPEQFETLWSTISHEFAIEPPTTDNPSKQRTLHAAIENDPVAQHLIATRRVKRTERDGRLHIDCPFAALHTTDGGDTATTYWPRLTGGYERGHFHCLHAHCSGRSDQEFLTGVGYEPVAVADEFEALADDDWGGEGVSLGTERSAAGRAGIESEGVNGADGDQGTLIKGTVNQEILIPGASDQGTLITKEKRRPFYVWKQRELRHQPDPEWIIDDVLPQAGFGILFGDSTVGKTFAMLDMAMAISEGTPWRGRATKRLRVVYVAAEGGPAFKNRVAAYCRQHDIDEDKIELGMVTEAPNFLDSANVLTLATTIKEMGGADLIILDTWSIVTLNSNENSGEDMGLALKNCRNLNVALKAMVIAIHHCGKDASKGARGWSGLRAAADFEMEVTRSGDFRKMKVTKLKEGEDGQEFGFQLVPHIIRVTPAGKEVVSCAIKETLVSTPKDRPSGKWQEVVWEVIQEFGQAQKTGIEIAAVIAEVKRRTVKDVDANGKDRRGQMIRQALDALARRNFLQIEDDCLSIL